MLEQDICDGCQKVTGVRYFAREDVWHCEGCQAYDLDAALTPCPNHEGAYDCTPFCPLCEGEQEYVAAPAAICSVCADQLDEETGYHIGYHLMDSEIICPQCIEVEERP